MGIMDLLGDLEDDIREHIMDICAIPIYGHMIMRRTHIWSCDPHLLGALEDDIREHIIACIDDSRTKPASHA